MKKSFTLLLTMFLVFGVWSIANAQPEGYYKKHHINQNFDGLEALPAEWSSVNGTTAIFGRGGSSSVIDGVLKTAGSGGGNRGVEILFPTPQTNTAIGTSETWFVELDWVVNGGNAGAKNAITLIFSGTGSQNVNNGTQWYADGIFGLYIMGDGFIHYWNMDNQGPLNETTEDPNDYYGPAFVSGQYPAYYRANADATVAETINAATKTAVTYTAGKTYHIMAELNFATQKVVSLTITDKDDAENTATFGEQNFLAPLLGGSESVVEAANRVVSDLGVITSLNTRSSNAGNGGNAALDVYLDNIEIYYLEQSLGQANVTINYKDREGGTAKESRIVSDQEISTIYNLLLTDKEGFIADNNYFAYDAEATHTANADKGNNNGESVIVAAEGSSLDVVFKKTAITTGTYVWTGASGFNWNELEDNFSVSNGANMSYQNGNAVEFSNADATNKEIMLPQNLNLGEGDLTVSAEGYSFSGEGRIEGTGTMLLDAPATIAIDNRLEGGAWVNTTGTVHIKHASAASSFALKVDNTKLRLEAGADFNKAIDGSGGTANFEMVSDNACNSVFTNLSTINIDYQVKGRLKSSTWTTNWVATFPENVQINVTNGLEDKAIAGFGVGNATLQTAKVHLGDSIRLLRNYNENGSGTDVVTIGELSGTAGSVVEGGFIDGRQGTYAIGNLNTDAVFEGTIRQFMPTESTSATSTLHLSKIGTGKWTLTGNSLFTGDITVKEGTLALSGFVASSVTQIRVDSAAIMEGMGVEVQASLVDAYKATVSGSMNVYNMQLTGSKLEMNINSFTEGDHDQVITQGDFTTIAALDDTPNVLDITVETATEGATVKLLNILGNPDISFNQILVNGEDITEVTEETEGAKFVWNNETGELLSKVNITSVPDVNANKVIREIEYFDLTGRPVNELTNGFVIRKITYTDDTQAVQKTFLMNR